MEPVNPFVFRWQIFCISDRRPGRFPLVEAPPVPALLDALSQVSHCAVSPSMSAGQVALTSLARSEPHGIGGPARQGKHGTARAMSQHRVAVDSTSRTFGKVSTEIVPDSLDDVGMMAGFEVRALRHLEAESIAVLSRKHRGVEGHPPQDADER